MSGRTYTQTARADATARTRAEILEAAQELYDEGDYEASLDRVASRAAVSVRTVLRHFGSKEGLIEAAIQRGNEQAIASREAPPGDVDRAITLLVDHYEEMGDRVLALLDIRDRYPLVRRATDSGRDAHRDWVARAFNADIAGLPPAARQTRISALASLTDVRVWGLLRRDHGLDRRATETAIRRFVNSERGAVR